MVSEELAVLLVVEVFALADVFLAGALVVADLVAVRLLVVPVEGFFVALDGEVAVVAADLVALDLRVPVVVEEVVADFVEALLVAVVLEAALLVAVALLAVLVASAFLAASLAAKRATCSTSKSTFALNISSCCSFF